MQIVMFFIKRVRRNIAPQLSQKRHKNVKKIKNGQKMISIEGEYRLTEQVFL